MKTKTLNPFRLKDKIIFLFLLLAFSFHVCKTPKEPDSLSEENWKLGWRMIESTWNDNYALAELQFDSLRSLNVPLTTSFWRTGLEAKMELSKVEEVIEIFGNQPTDLQIDICESDFIKDLSLCKNLPKEKIENKELEQEIIELFVADQAIRGNLMIDLIEKYQIDSTNIKRTYDYSNPDEINIDEINRNRLKEIFQEHGFPTRNLIGKMAMSGIFFIIQHADGDTAWQKSQLPNILKAVEAGELSKSNYTYLYDRIKVNSGEPQRYGSQFEKVDRVNKIAELRETEDLENLNQRRREMEMMPIETYRRLMLED